MATTNSAQKFKIALRKSATHVAYNEENRTFVTEPAQQAGNSNFARRHPGVEATNTPMLNNDVYKQLNNDFTPVPFARFQHPLM